MSAVSESSKILFHASSSGMAFSRPDFQEYFQAHHVQLPLRKGDAVFFNPALFHKTDDCRFAEGYLNKRINVSLLFGEFGAPTR